MDGGWVRTAGPYVAFFGGVAVSLTAFFINDRSNALERITKIETHYTDQDKEISRRLDNIENELRQLRDVIAPVRK